MRLFLLLACVLLVTRPSAGQNLMGLATSPYGGTHRAYLNPALTANSPFQSYVNLFTGNAHVNNNYVRYRAPYSLLNLLQGNIPDEYRRADGSVRFMTNYTAEIIDNNPKSGTVWGEVRGPSAQFSVGQRGSLTIASRLRAAAQVTDASLELLSVVRQGLGNISPFSIPNRNNEFSANTNTFGELALSYAGTLWEGDGQLLYGGFTAKYLVGYASGHLINRGLDYRLVADQSLRDGAYLEVTRLNASLGYTNYLQNRRLTPRTLLSPDAPGRGFGMDFGVAFASQPDPDGPLLRLGLALTDIGSIRYNGQAYRYDYNSADETGGVRFASEDFDGVTTTEGFAEVIQNRLDNGRIGDETRFRTGLPTSMNLSAEWLDVSGLGLSVVWMQDMRAKNATTMHQPSLVSVTPRFERRGVALAVPLTYLNRGFNAGLALKLGPVWLGSDNLLGLIGNGTNGISPRGVDVYAGLTFGMNKRRVE